MSAVSIQLPPASTNLSINFIACSSEADGLPGCQNINKKITKRQGHTSPEATQDQQYRVVLLWLAWLQEFWSQSFGY